MKINLIATITFILLASRLALEAPKSFIEWSGLHNPVLSYPYWSIKDPAMSYRGGVFYVFFSAFYRDDGQIRSHVVEISTRDFKTFSKPIVDFDGKKGGFIGMCSPDVQWLGNRYVLCFNSWGDNPNKPHQLFYMTSKDLVHWSPRRPLAANLTAGQGVDDVSLTRAAGGYYAIWKEALIPHGLSRRLAVKKSLSRPWHYGLRPQLAAARSLSGPWHLVGSGYPVLNMADGRENGLIHENFEFIRFNGVLHVLSSDYPHGHYSYLYTLLNPAKPLEWGKGFRLNIPAQDFSEMVPCESAALYDFRKEDGYFYLIYAGRNEQTTYLHRGWNRLGLARSKDLVNWVPAGFNRDSVELSR